MNSILGNFELIHWWEYKAIYCSTPYPCEEITDRSKAPPIPAAKVSQLKINFERYARFHKEKNFFNTNYKYWKRKDNCV